MEMNGIPVLNVNGKTLPEVWEKAVLLTWENGLRIRTEYDKQQDPESRDATMVMIIEEPMSEPRIHRAFPAGLEDLEIYRQEVIYGIHDHWICPEEGKWTYTYHQRLFSYPDNNSFIDQISFIVDKLSTVPHSRRAQAITWIAGLDPKTDDPPCLQRIWCRLSSEQGRWLLNMNAHWRSRDAYKATFMNIFALTCLQSQIAKRIEKNIGRRVDVGRYVDISDSFHIYGSYFKEFENFLNTVKTRKWEDRVWNTEFAEPIFEETRKKIEGQK
jgi:thymidylate synthase